MRSVRPQQQRSSITSRPFGIASKYSTHFDQGYRLTFIGQEQVGALKQVDWGPSSKLRGPGFGGEFNSFQHHMQSIKFAMLIIDVRGLQNHWGRHSCAVRSTMQWELHTWVRTRAVVQTPWL